MTSETVTFVVIGIFAVALIAVSFFIGTSNNFSKKFDKDQK